MVHSCTDDTGEFFMTNEAILHYHYSGNNENKHVREALRFHGNVSWSYYDAIFANSGNHPAMSEESAVQSAIEIQDAGVSFFWLSNYDGVGAMSEWKESNRLRFHESGARYVDISAMTSGLDALTKAKVEHLEHDPHFCLPGPPDEMGLLLLKIMWAVHEGYSHREINSSSHRGSFTPVGERYSHALLMFLPAAVVLLSVWRFVSYRGWCVRGSHLSSTKSAPQVLHAPISEGSELAQIRIQPL